eukprot:Hpha_TRINITY_DN25179_c0_g1::TRINITY_DN25179_c0_g1_i1::g.139332::m.139332
MSRPVAKKAARGLRGLHATHPPAEVARAVRRRRESTDHPRGPPPQQRRAGIAESLISGDLSAVEMREACTRSRLEELCPDMRFVTRDRASRRKLEGALAVIAESVVRREGELHALGPGDLRRLVHVYAKASERAPLLFSAVASAAVGKVGEFNAKNLTLVVWAFAKVKHNAAVLFDAAAKTVEVTIRTFNPQDLSNTAWAYATIKYKARALF